MRGARKNQAFYLFLDRGGLWRTPGHPSRRIRSACPDKSIWALQADDRMDARGRRQGARSEVRDFTLFQWRRRRPKGASWPIDAERDASDQGRGAGGARITPRSRSLRHRLSNQGRHLHPRLYPGQRSGRSPYHDARLPAQGRRKSHLQLRLWPWRLGVRSRRCRQASIRRRFQGVCGFPAGVLAIRCRSSRARSASRPCSAGLRNTTIFQPSLVKRSNGSAACTTNPSRDARARIPWRATRSDQVFMDSKKVVLPFGVSRNLPSRNSIPSIVPIGLRIRRSTYIFFRISGDTSNSSLRVPERVMSIDGKVRLSATLRSRMISELPVPLNSSKITSSMRSEEQ